MTYIMHNMSLNNVVTCHDSHMRCSAATKEALHQGVSKGRTAPPHPRQGLVRFSIASGKRCTNPVAKTTPAAKARPMMKAALSVANHRTRLLSSGRQTPESAVSTAARQVVFDLTGVC